MNTRDILEFPGYVIDETGTVYKDLPASGRWREKFPSENQNGTVYVGLMKDGVQYNRTVAGLVLQAFDPLDWDNYYFEKDPDTRMIPLHKNCNPRDNHINNLCWRPDFYVKRYNKEMPALLSADGGEFMGVDIEEVRFRNVEGRSMNLVDICALEGAVPSEVLWYDKPELNSFYHRVPYSDRRIFYV